MAGLPSVRAVFGRHRERRWGDRYWSSRNHIDAFDLDGVISDTQTLHSEIEAAIFQRYGIKKSVEEITEKYALLPYIPIPSAALLASYV